MSCTISANQPLVPTAGEHTNWEFSTNWSNHAMSSASSCGTMCLPFMAAAQSAARILDMNLWAGLMQWREGEAEGTVPVGGHRTPLGSVLVLRRRQQSHPNSTAGNGPCRMPEFMLAFPRYDSSRMTHCSAALRFGCIIMRFTRIHGWKRGSGVHRGADHGANGFWRPV